MSSQPETMAKQILLVDESPDDSEILLYLLRRNRVSNPILVLRSGSVALDFFSGIFPYSERQVYPFPSLLFLDLNLPGANGYEMMQWLNRHPEVPRPKILIYTQTTLWSELRKCRELGADGFLLKQTLHEQLPFFLADFPGIWDFSYPAGPQEFP